jgi:hypothetical protein
MRGPLARGFVSGQSGRKTHNGLVGGKTPTFPHLHASPSKSMVSVFPHPSRIPPSTSPTFMLTVDLEYHNEPGEPKSSVTPSSHHGPRQTLRPNINASVHLRTLPDPRSGESMRCSLARVLPRCLSFTNGLTADEDSRHFTSQHLTSAHLPPHLTSQHHAMYTQC